MRNVLREAAQGTGALGAWMTLREPLLTEAAANAGFDYVCIDLQHGLVGFEQLPGHLQALASGLATPIVRVPWNEQWMIGEALDAGAVGVIVPMVNTAEEAEYAAASCRYAPRGRRSFGPTAAATRYAGYYPDGVGVMCIVMVETTEAVANIAQIAAVPGVDAIYVGPNDLAITMGLPPGNDQADEEFERSLTTIVETCRQHSVIPGIHADATLASGHRVRGFRMITVASDHAAAVGGLQRDLARARQ